MTDKKDKIPPQQDKVVIIEKGQKTDLNENKLPDFKFTPAPPPPPKTEGLSDVNDSLE